MLGSAYTLTRKPVKNINLRVASDGSVHVSAPPSISRACIDAFVQSKQHWIQSVQRRLQSASKVPANANLFPTRECLERFKPMLQSSLGRLHQPDALLRVRSCTSLWGSCQPKSRTIMLNRALYALPDALVEYVVLHECVHLVAHDHGPYFHALMKTHMPDYLQRRKALAQYDPVGGRS